MTEQQPSSLHVGVFETSEIVPKKLQGTHIYYSPELKKFAIVDKNGTTLNFFDFNKYSQFETANVISYDGNIKAYIDDQLQLVKDTQASTLENLIQGDAPHINSAEDDHTNNSQAGDADAIKVEDYITTPDIPSSDPLNEPVPKFLKDPSKHLGVKFFFLILLTIIACCLILFLPDLLERSGSLF